MKSILDRSFQYVPADKTDLRATFARIRARAEDRRRDAQGAGSRGVDTRTHAAEAMGTINDTNR
jgi:hypothetical protein